MLGPMFGTATTPHRRRAGPPATRPPVPPNAPSPLQPGQVMLNGVPTTVGDATAGSHGGSGFFGGWRVFGGRRR